jgi:hypothetical protein
MKWRVNRSHVRVPVMVGVYNMAVVFQSILQKQQSSIKKQQMVIVQTEQTALQSVWNEDLALSWTFTDRCYIIERQHHKRHPSGMNNFGRCLEYGQEIEADPIRAATYYRLSVELKDADGAHNFGVCLEKSIGVRVNIDVAANGHADGSNNFGFCLEHGRGVKQDIPLATEYCKRAADLGHPEADINYRDAFVCWDYGRFPIDHRMYLSKNQCLKKDKGYEQIFSKPHSKRLQTREFQLTRLMIGRLETR